MAIDVEHYTTILRRIYGERDWISTASVLYMAAWTGYALLDKMGAHHVLAIGASRGAGDLPEYEQLLQFSLDHEEHGGSMMTSIRESMRQLADLPPEVEARVEAFDPDHKARAIGPIFDLGLPVAGRAKFGARPVSWQALEDKTTIDALWDDVAIARAPSRIVESTHDALWGAHLDLDDGLGTVWVGDNREGFHGGAEYLRWVRSRQDAQRASEFLAGVSDRARVMPFLEGIPCSIHGMVFPDQTITLRPCEMIVLRHPTLPRLHYSSAATFWDAQPEDARAMRQMAQRVGDALRARVGYRGAFTIDGVMTDEGFVPTELNPRFGAALTYLTRPTPGLHMMLINLAVVEGIEADWRPGELEALIMGNSRDHRAGRRASDLPRADRGARRTRSRLLAHFRRLLGVPRGPTPRRVADRRAARRRHLLARELRAVAHPYRPLDRRARRARSLVRRRLPRSGSELMGARQGCARPTRRRVVRQHEKDSSDGLHADTRSPTFHAQDAPTRVARTHPT